MATVRVLNTDSGLSGRTLLVAELAQTVTGLLTFNRAPSAPFAVQAGSATVTNLDADKLDGQDGTYYLDLATHTGVLALSRGGTGSALTDPNADRILFWQDSTNAVTWLSVGPTLRISGTVLDVELNSSQGQVLFNADGTTLAGDAGLTYDGTTDVLSVAGQVAVSGAAPATPPALNRLYRDTVVTAWLNCNLINGTPTIVADVNVASIVDNGVGSWTVNLATPLASTAAVALASPKTGSARVRAAAEVATTSAVAVQMWDDAIPTPVDYHFCLLVVGGA